MDLVQNTLFVSGYWQVAGNQKRDLNVYLDNLRDTLKMIKGGRLIFYTSVMDKADEITAFCRKLSIDVQIIESSISSLPAADKAESFTEQAFKMNIDRLSFLTLPSKEKGIAHYRRDLKPDPFVYQQMLTIWLSKFELVNNHLDGEEYCAWIDAGFSRVRYERSNCNLQKLKIKNDKISFYSSPMTFFGQPIPVSAGFLHANKGCWLTFLKIFRQCTISFKNLPYPIDEEIIIAEVYSRNPNLFHLIGSPYKLNGKLHREIHWQYVKLMKIFSTHY